MAETSGMSTIVSPQITTKHEQLTKGSTSHWVNHLLGTFKKVSYSFYITL